MQKSRDNSFTSFAYVKVEQQQHIKIGLEELHKTTISAISHTRAFNATFYNSNCDLVPLGFFIHSTTSICGVLIFSLYVCQPAPTAPAPPFEIIAV